MINLLPPETRKAYQYARRNRSLVHWVIAFLTALAGLGVIATYGLVTMRQATNSYQQQVSASQDSLKQNNLTQTEAKVNDISNSFKLVVNVLGREVLFSKLLTQIGTVIPAGVNLTGLTINQDDGAIDLSAKATDYNAATQLQANLTDPSNKIFTKADLVNVGCGKNADSSGTGADPTHPCTVNIRALFGPNNPFLFINNNVLAGRS
jgi:Tfp pilus assembly protein PilN